MSKHYEVVEYEDSSTIPTRRVVYSGSDQAEAKACMRRLKFERSHEMRVDGQLESSVVVARARPRVTDARGDYFRQLLKQLGFDDA
jgi:hypothetical protein